MLRAQVQKDRFLLDAVLLVWQYEIDSLLAQCMSSDYLTLDEVISQHEVTYARDKSLGNTQKKRETQDNLMRLRQLQQLKTMRDKLEKDIATKMQ